MFKQFAIEYRYHGTGNGGWQRWQDYRWVLRYSRDRVLLELRIIHFKTFEFRATEISAYERDFERKARQRDPTGYADTTAKVVGGRLARG